MSEEIWLNLSDWIKFSNTKEFKKIKKMSEKIKVLEKELNEYTVNILKKYRIEHTAE